MMMNDLDEVDSRLCSCLYVIYHVNSRLVLTDLLLLVPSLILECQEGTDGSVSHFSNDIYNIIYNIILNILDVLVSIPCILSNDG